MSGLFGTFNIATRGLFAQQKAIDTTSHNIANANTEGYSRQRVTLQTSRPFPMPSINNAVGPGQMGTGVDVKSVDRIRDSFLDYQVRVEMGVNGQFSGRDKFLSEIENIMNEPTDTGISSLIGKFFDSWNTLGTSASKSNAKSIVAQQSLALANELNHTYTELESLKKNTQTVIKDTVFDINSILKQVNQINQQIAQVKVAGNNPNDLMDRRDLLLDQLSSKFGIKIDKRAFDGYDVTTSNESKYADAGDNGTAPTGPKGILNLVQSTNPEDTCRFSSIDSIIKDGSSEEKFDGPGSYTVTYYKNGDKTTDANKVTIKVNINDTGAKGDPGYVSAEDKFKQLSECRVLWANNNGVALKTDGKGNVASIKDADNLVNSDTPLAVDFENLALFKAPSGELKGYMSVQKDVDTYEGQLNKFAKALALSVNSIMSQSLDPSVDTATDINNFFVNADAAKNGVYTGTDASKITSAEKEITAANITVNDAILKNPMLIKSAAQYDASGNPIGESDGTRALAVEMLRDSLMKIQDISSDTTRTDFLKDNFNKDPKLNISVVTNVTGGMTLDSYFKDTVNRLGIQEQEAKRMVTNQAKLLSSFQESKDSVSGVSLDEEMANLVQFQHCYQANAKIISTVDELLDVVVNGLKK
ncbi:flagellar hook-associated protein FlgK [Clostridium sp. OS1-26]|uniref:flagellar hook-associated protein FlgK n=1 Tax=Clostridium sp. OS1-26 TaxID=3070681 RepID=UPI0027DF58BF|nr:flagellar hook-associated protein FlgK [Clostridium sp. OS1-26]WML35507.1 flagellar hook-associated protein FlgK [Clostridium sp. OS1-26]